MEEKRTEEMLEDEIRSQIDGLGSLTIGSKELDTAVNNVATLYKLRIDEKRIDADIDDKLMKTKQEQANREVQQKEAKKERYINIGLRCAELGLPLAVYAALYLMGFKLEYVDHGMMSSSTMRNLFNQLKVKKK